MKCTSCCGGCSVQARLPGHSSFKYFKCDRLGLSDFFEIQLNIIMSALKACHLHLVFAQISRKKILLQFGSLAEYESVTA